MTVYWGHGGMRGGTGVCMGEYQGCAAVLGSRTVGGLRSPMAVRGCPPDPSNNSWGMQGHPLTP